MPGPGPHMMYTLGSGLGLMSVSNGRFSPHHCLTYSINAFFGPDIGSFSEWLTSTLGLGSALGYAIEPWIHDPFYYILILGIPMSMLYSEASKFLLKKGLLDSVSGVALTRKQCLFLAAAGSLSHFFLDHLFEENGKSTMYTWILSTGWWEGRAPINPDAVVVVCILCCCLIADFIYINRVKPLKLLKLRVINSVKLMLVIATLYCLWCASQVYLVRPRRPAVGEEADLGVLVFMGIYFFLPHWLCILSMNSRDPQELMPL
ncbi:uncharacterized protein LOC132601309 [Lycium barbarum]|uniref:uncharacterized protein LOC132601309 n=1 Tax=Lycium barbarum TaxID=112863 RepID=UPI00293E678C|nr:uncharacterized protein LOC132601309 [Lycium barbarum]